MLNSVWITVPVAAALGFLSGLGTGGGSLLILWLTAVLGMDPGNARSINLMFFIPSALIASLFRKGDQRPVLKKILPAMLAGCACAFGASLLRQNLDLQILEKLFGALLVITGFREILYRPKAGQ